MDVELKEAKARKAATMAAATMATAILEKMPAKVVGAMVEKIAKTVTSRTMEAAMEMIAVAAEAIAAAMMIRRKN